MTQRPAPTPVRIRLPRPIGALLSRLIAARTVQPGAVVPPPAALNVTRRTLLSFKTEACVACVACDTLDVFLGQLAHTHGLDLRVIDARRGDLPSHAYGDALHLDADGSLRRPYRVQVYPTLVLTGPDGRIEAVVTNVPEQDAQASVTRGLGLA
ncbi:hypothetical protein [Deinococcus kurensis]|uniref:hypothetical protein n=1 Tax=Deinococcus kurensis TaxID=2662757 RepID=UPI0012D2E0BF|nr:hypothetical protein [Deinococcus kurensis]